MRTAFEQLCEIESKLDTANAALRGVIRCLEKRGEQTTALNVLFALDRISEAKRALGCAPVAEAKGARV
jgi:hypothetical protein